MTNHFSLSARARSAIATSASALLTSLALLPAASAQTQSVDPRWQPFLGCWVPDQASAAIGTNSVSGSMVCVVPVQNSPSVDITTINNRVVVNRDRFTVNGERSAKKADDCPGFETSNWSADGHRIYTRSEYSCGANLNVKGTSVFALTSTGDWVQVQGTTIGTNAGARVVRFRPADVALAPGSIISDSSVVTTVPLQSSFTTQALRSAAGAPTDAKALLDIAKNVNEQVAQAWLSEFGIATKLNAQELIALSDAGMPSNLTDMMVAMSNPLRFQLQTRSPTSVAGVQTLSAAQLDDLRRCGLDDLTDPRVDLGMSSIDRRYCLSRYGSVFGSPFGYLGVSRYGFDMYNRYGYSGYNGGNYYYGSQPIIIVTRGADDDTPVIKGRAVKGGGYSSGSSSSAGSSTPRQSSNPSSGSSGSSSSGSSSSGASSGGSTSGGDAGARTAKPRPPGGN